MKKTLKLSVIIDQKKHPNLTQFLAKKAPEFRTFLCEIGHFFLIKSCQFWGRFRDPQNPNFRIFTKFANLSKFSHSGRKLGENRDSMRK
jgi:hypothetical protein